MKLKTLILLALSAFLTACSSGDSAGDEGTGGGQGEGSGQTQGLTLPAAEVVTQESITLEEFNAEASADPALEEIASGLNLNVAGLSVDSAGVEVTWAEGTDSSGSLLGAIRYCDGDACVHALQSAESSGLSWRDAAGASLTPKTMGRPVLSKQLTGQSLDGRTVIAAQGLSSTNIDFVDPEALPSYDYKTREFIALNTFGPAFGVTLETLTDAATKSGAFDVVDEHYYVRESTLQETFEALDGMDALVWMTQSVRQETKGDWRASRSVGYTVNRGGFGDHTLDRDAVKEALNFNLAGGLGLVVLAASASYSDGSEGQPDSGSAWEKIKDRDRVVVGVKGLASTEAILLAVAAFLDAYLSGEVSLEDALQLGSVPLAGEGASLESNQFDVDLDKLWTANAAAVWNDLSVFPNSAHIRVPIAAIPYCAAEGQQRQAGDEDQAQPFTDIEFDGAYFSGASETSLTGVDVRVNVVGTVTGFEPGDRVFLEIWGDFDESFRDFHAFGEGTIQEVSTDDSGVVTVGFNGNAFAIPYTNGEGESCVLNGPKLQTTTSGLAAFVLTP